MRESQPSSSTTLDNESVDNQLQHSDHMKEDNSDNSSDVTGKISAKEHDNQIDKNNADLEQVTFKLTEDKEMKKLEDAVVTAPTLEKEKSIVKIGTDTTDDLSTVDNKNAESLAPGDVLTPQRLIDEIELVLNSSPNIANTDVKHNLVIISTEAANADEIEDKGK